MSKEFVGSNLVDGCCVKRNEDVNMSLAGAAATTNLAAIPSTAACCGKHHDWVVNRYPYHQTTAK